MINIEVLEFGASYIRDFTVYNMTATNISIECPIDLQYVVQYNECN